MEIEKINQYPVDSSKINELENGWENIAYTDVVAMYSKIGWKLDEKIGEIETSHDNELDSSYYRVAFPNIYKK